MQRDQIPGEARRRAALELGLSLRTSKAYPHLAMHFIVPLALYVPLWAPQREGGRLSVCRQRVRQGELEDVAIGRGGEGKQLVVELTRERRREHPSGEHQASKYYVEGQERLESVGALRVHA